MKVSIFAVETRTHWLPVEIMFLPAHSRKRRIIMKQGMYKMLAAALMLTISGGGSG